MQYQQQPFQLQFGFYRVIGSRDHQEDEFTIVDGLNNQKGVSYFGIFDGHGNNKASAHASAHAHQFVLGSPCLIQGDLCGAIREGIREEDRALYQYMKMDQMQHPSLNHELTGGCTATIALITATQLSLGNVGDSRAVLAVKNGSSLKHLRLSQDHKPDERDEMARIVQAGGTVVDGRVRAESSHSAINMSRALGDFDFKAPLNHANADFISSEPYLTRPIPLDPSMKFLVMASDGLWDVYNDEQVTIMVNQLQESGLQPEQIARTLAHKVEHKKGADNTTIIVIFFCWANQQMQGVVPGVVVSGK